MIDQFAQWLAGLLREWRMKQRRKAVGKLSIRLHAMGYAVLSARGLELSLYGNNEAYLCPPPLPDGAHDAERPTPAPVHNVNRG